MGMCGICCCKIEQQMNNNEIITSCVQSNEVNSDELSQSNSVIQDSQYNGDNYDLKEECLLKSDFLNTKNVRELTFQNMEIKSFYLLHKTSYMFLKLINRESRNFLKLINFDSRKDLGTIEFNYRNLQILMYDDAFQNLNSLNELNGSIIYVPFSGPFLYCVNFKNEVLIEKQFENSFLNDKIKILPLDLNTFALFFEKRILLFGFNGIEIKSFQEIYINEKIRYIKTTLPETKIFSYSYLKKFLPILIIVVAKKKIKIYRYNKIRIFLDLISVFDHHIDWNDWINWDFFERDLLNKQVSNSLIIDNFDLRREVLIRFLIIEKDRVFNLVEIIEDNGEYVKSYEKFNKIQLGIETYSNDCVIPISFNEKKIHVWLIDNSVVNTEEHNGFLLVYDLGKQFILNNKMNLFNMIST
jgi:hypothetical protein